MPKIYKTGITFGCWDLLHAGHLLFLNGSMASCERLIVGLQWNPSIERADKNHPVQSLLERYIQLDMTLRPEDMIVPYEVEDDIATMIQSYNADVRLIGQDYQGKDFTAMDLLPTVFLPRDHGFSSSELRRRIYHAEAEKVSRENHAQYPGPPPPPCPPPTKSW